MGISGHIMAGSMIASAKPVDNALNPAWRDTAVHMIVKASWSKSLSSTQVQRIHERMTNRVGYAMRKISPDSGCYVNEVSSELLFTFEGTADLMWCDQYEPDWQWALYGPNYSRLRAIKAEYDPDEVLWCRKCVGSEEWQYEQESGKLCRRSLIQNWPDYGMPTSL
jgi:hypothetical protein